MSDEDPYLELSRALARHGIEHKLKVMPCDDGILYAIEAIPHFPSVVSFANACYACGFDATYSAASGWSFLKKAGPPAAS